jgi:hypothetical protein
MGRWLRGGRFHLPLLHSAAVPTRRRRWQREMSRIGSDAAATAAACLRGDALVGHGGSRTLRKALH